MTREICLLILLLPALIVCLPVCLYLSVLTLAAPAGLRIRPPQAGAAMRFTIIVPAHNEAAVLGRLLASIASVDYPASLYRVVVVADNCDDRTPQIAAEHGADVLERRDPERTGKGWALSWLLARLPERAKECDAVAVLDADSAISANFLAALNDHFQAGAQIVQAYYTVLPVRGAWAESVREASLALVHLLRPSAKTAMALSCGLKGTGMAFKRSVIERSGWPTRGLAEDVEFHLALIERGLRVTFAPEAVVRAEMPASLRQAGSQNRRWEAGRLATIRTMALPLFWAGLRRRSLVQMDAAFEQFVPPISVPATLLAVCLIAALFLHAGFLAAFSAAMLAVLGIHVLAALALARVPPRVYGSLCLAPIYISWKFILYARVLLSADRSEWIRTSRQTAE
jgi:cellulose synthase/poly-beta-1,6-N-acetylglucosamine synthase-like glycosyltransferase